MDICEKCNGTDILTRYIEEGKLIDSSSWKRIENEFIASKEYEIFYQLKAKKEHLHKHCRNCQYNWDENIANQPSK